MNNFRTCLDRFGLVAIGVALTTFWQAGGWPYLIATAVATACIVLGRPFTTKEDLA
jgi:hypothetical protein